MPNLKIIVKTIIQETKKITSDNKGNFNLKSKLPWDNSKNV